MSLSATNILEFFYLYFLQAKYARRSVPEDPMTEGQYQKSYNRRPVPKGPMTEGPMTEGQYQKAKCARRPVPEPLGYLLPTPPHPQHEMAWDQEDTLTPLPGKDTGPWTWKEPGTRDTHNPPHEQNDWQTLVKTLPSFASVKIRITGSFCIDGSR